MHKSIPSFVISLLCIIFSGPQAQADTLFVPIRSNSGRTEQILEVDVGTGRTQRFAVQRNGLRLRVDKKLNQNFLEVMGRQTAATHGEILFRSYAGRGGRSESLILLEGSTGWAAKFTELDTKKEIGLMQSLAGRPTVSIAAGDAGFILLHREDRFGRTQAFWLVHTPTGACRTISGLEQDSTTATVNTCTGFPQTPVGSKATEIFDEAGATSGFILASRSGTLSFLRITSATSVRTENYSLDLTTSLGVDAPSLGSLRLVSLHRRGGITDRVLVLHNDSGILGILSGIASGAVRFTTLPSSISPIPASNRSTLELVPMYSNRSDVSGVWLAKARGVWRFLPLDDDSPQRLLPVQKAN